MSDKRVKLFRSTPGLGDFFSVLMAKETDDINRFRDEKRLCAYAGLVSSTYGSVGKLFQGIVTGMDSKWLSWACIQAIQSAIICRADVSAYYRRLKMKQGANTAKVISARRLLTVAYRVLSKPRLSDRRNTRMTCNSTPAALLTSQLMLTHRVLSKVIV